MISDPPTEATTWCQQCGQPFIYPPIYFRGEETFKPPLCGPCEAVVGEAEHLKALCEAQEARRAAFMTQVPPLYRDTDKTRLEPILAQTADEWQFSKRGLALIGRAGTGKTRCAVLILRRMAVEDCRTICFLTCTALANAAANSFSGDAQEKAKAKETVANAMTAKVLVLDDLGKNRMTERAETTLYELFEHRTGHLLPTIWTGNSNAADLHSMFSSDRADALIRRMGKEFCAIVHV